MAKYRFIYSQELMGWSSKAGEIFEKENDDEALSECENFLKRQAGRSQHTGISRTPKLLLKIVKEW